MDGAGVAGLLVLTWIVSMWLVYKDNCYPIDEKKHTIKGWVGLVILISLTLFVLWATVLNPANAIFCCFVLVVNGLLIGSFLSLSSKLDKFYWFLEEKMDIASHECYLKMEKRQWKKIQKWKKKQKGYGELKNNASEVQKNHKNGYSRVSTDIQKIGDACEQLKSELEN